MNEPKSANSDLGCRIRSHGTLLLFGCRTRLTEGMRSNQDYGGEGKKTEEEHKQTAKVNDGVELER